MTATHRGRSAGRATPEPRTSAEAVRRATGRDRDEWFALLDDWGAVDRSHKDIASWLMSEHGVHGWWAQALTVDYEQARGLRAPGGKRDGTFEAGASKTVAVPVGRLYDAFVDPRQRRRWLPGVTMTERAVQPSRSARFDWDDGATRVVVGFMSKGENKSQVAVVHERHRNAKAADEAKAFWRERLRELKMLLEG